MEKKTSKEIALIAIVAALYAVITLTPGINMLSYGAVQLRFAEGLNHLAVFNKRYIWAMGLGVLIANLASPLGWIDWVFGTAGTLAMTGLSYLLTRNVKSIIKKLAISTVIDAFFMFGVALELVVVGFEKSFFATWGIIALGELAALILGAVIIYLLNKRIDLTK